VAERAVYAPKAALQIAEVLIVRQLGDRIKDDAVRPGVVVEQLGKFVNRG